MLFIAEEQAQQLEQQMCKVEVDAPRWRYFEYVLNSDSAVNSMLETALRSVTLSVPLAMLPKSRAYTHLVRVDPKAQPVQSLSG